MCVNGTLSNYGSLKAGVPQGSVLGPCLFLIDINDIVHELDCAIILFVDDTSIGTSSTDISFIEFKLNTKFIKRYEYSQKRLVTFNPNKINVIMFSQRKRPNEPQFVFGDSV